MRLSSTHLSWVRSELNIITKYVCCGCGRDWMRLCVCVCVCVCVQDNSIWHSWIHRLSFYLWANLSVICLLLWKCKQMFCKPTKLLTWFTSPTRISWGSLSLPWSSSSASPSSCCCCCWYCTSCCCCYCEWSILSWHFNWQFGRLDAQWLCYAKCRRTPTVA